MGIGARGHGPTEGGLGGLTGPGVGCDFDALVSEFRGVAPKPRPCVLFCLWGPGLGTGSITCDTPSAHWYQALAPGLRHRLKVWVPGGGVPWGWVPVRRSLTLTSPSLGPAWGPATAWPWGWAWRRCGCPGRGIAQRAPPPWGLLWFVEWEHCGCPPTSFQRGG